MIEIPHDSLSPLELGLMDASVKQKKIASEYHDGDAPEQVTKNPLVEKLVNNTEIYKLFLRANSAKRELLGALTQALPDEVDNVQIQLGQLKISDDSVRELQGAEWELPIVGSSEPKRITTLLTEHITRTLGVDVLDFHTGAELRLDKIQGFASQPTKIQGSLRIPGQEQLQLKQLEYNNPIARKLILQVAEQRLSAAVVQAVLDGQEQLSNLTSTLQNLKKDYIRSVDSGN